MMCNKNNQSESIFPDGSWPFWSLTGILLAVMLAAFVRHVLVTLPFPYPVEYGEGVVVNWMMRLSRGMELYPAISRDDMPWLHNPYGPLWFWLSALLPDFGPGVFAKARTLSLVFFAVSLFLVYRLCRRDLKPAGAACVCVLFGASPLIWRYAVMARVDMAALAASLTALLLMERGTAGRGAGEGEGVRRSDRPAMFRWFFAGLAASAALLVKPVFVAAPLAGLAAGLRQGRSKTISFAAGLALPLLGAGIWLLIRGERSVLEHFGAMNRIGVSIPLMIVIALGGAGRHPFVLLAFFTGFRRLDHGSPRWWFALFMAASLLLGVKIGADSHYFIPPLIAAVLLAAPLTSHVISRGGMKLLLLCLSAQLALYLPVAPRPVFTATYGQEVPAGHSALTPGESDREIGRLLVGEIVGVDGPVMADDPGYLLAGGREVLIQPFQYGRLAEAGRLDTDALTRRIEEGYFALIIIRDEQAGGPSASDFPPDVIESVRRNYQLHREIGPYLLYVED